MQFSAAQTLLSLKIGQTTGFTSNTAAQLKLLLNVALHKTEEEVGYIRARKRLFSHDGYAHFAVSSVKPTITGAEALIDIIETQYQYEGAGRMYPVVRRPYEDVVEYFSEWNRLGISETLDNAAAVNYNATIAGSTKLAITGTTIVEGDKVTIAGTTNYDGTHFNLATIADAIAINVAYVAETPAGTETAVVDDPAPVSTIIDACGYDEARGFVIYPGQSGDGMLDIVWSKTSIDLVGDTTVPDTLPGFLHYGWVERAAHEFLSLEGGVEDPRTVEYWNKFVAPWMIRVNAWNIKLNPHRTHLYGNARG